MSAPVTETDTFPSAVVAPGINDTNYYTIVPEGMGQLASRTKWLKTTLATGGASSFGADDLNPNATTSQLTTITLPASGRADLFRNALTGLGQTTRWLRERVFGAGATASTLRWCPSPITYTAANWSLNAGTSAFFIYQAALSTSPMILTFPALPAGLYLSNLRLLVSSPASHGGSLPATMPEVLLLGQGGSGSASTIASASDASANTTVYEGAHEITVTMNHVVQSDLAYTLAVRGEDSTNAQANSFRIFRASVDVWYV